MRNRKKYKVYYKSSESMKEVEDKSVQLIFTSPPYYNLKEYKGKPKKQKGQIPNSPSSYHQNYSEYLNEMNRIAQECSRVIKDDGVIIYNVDIIKFKTKDKNIIPLPFEFIKIFENLGIGCKDIMIYKKLFALPFNFGKKLRNVHEYLLVFSKSNDYKFNLDSVRYPYEDDYVYPEGHKRRNKIGKSPSSVWEFYPPSQSKTVHYHYCPFPNELVDRAIKLYTDESDIVLDPFLGSGVVVARSVKLNRFGIGYEINDKFEEVIDNIIKHGKFNPKKS